MTFREALEKRLDLVKPSEEKVEEFVQLNKLHLTPGMRLLSIILPCNHRTNLMDFLCNIFLISKPLFI